MPRSAAGPLPETVKGRNGAVSLPRSKRSFRVWLCLCLVFGSWKELKHYTNAHWLNAVHKVG